MEGTGTYLMLVVIGVVITVVVGQILLRSGQPFLEDVFQHKETAHSINRLLVVMFHLLTLGVLGMVSIVDVDGGGTAQTVVFKLGFVLLIVGIAYGISMLVLLRVRERRRQAAVSAAIDEKLAEQRQDRGRGGRFRRGGVGPDGETRQTPTDRSED